MPVRVEWWTVEAVAHDGKGTIYVAVPEAFLMMLAYPPENVSTQTAFPPFFAAPR